MQHGVRWEELLLYISRDVWYYHFFSCSDMLHFL